MTSQLIGMESFCDFHSMIADDFQTELSQTHVESILPKVNLNIKEGHQHQLPPLTLPKNEVRLAFLPKDGQEIPFWKKFIITWQSQGIYQALDLFAQVDLQADKNSVNKISQCVSVAWNTMKILHNNIVTRSNTSVSSCANTVALFSKTKDWLGSPIRCLAWHPNCIKLAVATRDDTILVYAGSSSVPVTIRHPSQKDISSLQWRPLCSSQLAVGCASGVGIWTLDPASLGTRPPASCFTLLPHATSVNSISWHPQGKLLASGSAKDSTLYIWNVENREATPLKRFRGCGFTFLTWSPSGEHLFASTTGSIFKIWETRTWTAENWNVMDGYVQAAVWSPCGNKVIFADSVQPTLYCLSVDPVAPLGEKPLPALKNSSSKAANVVADLTESQYLNEDTRIGGLVQDLSWDPRGERLAIIFRSTDYVALYRTRYSPTFSIVPCNVIKGQAGEVASTIEFKSEFENGALLTVCWSSSRVQHVTFSLAQNLEM